MEIAEFINILKKRKSIRRFKFEIEISRDKERALLEAGRLAPSAGNMQTWHFFVVRGKALKQKIAKVAFDQSFITQAPLVVIVAIDKIRARRGYGKRGLELYGIQDTAAAIQNMLLAARVMGIGSCWVGAFSEYDLEHALVIDRKRFRTVAIIPFGYPAEDPPARGRMSLKKVVTYL